MIREKTKAEKLLLIGGPGSVIGKRLLEKLRVCEYQVAATYHTHMELSKYSQDKRLSLYSLDITSHKEVESLVNKVEMELGSIDILINNAGIFSGNVLPFMKYTDWQRVLNVNLTGVFNVCKFVSRKMMRKRKGKIINLASRIGLTGGIGESAYATSKAGIIVLTKSLARELSRYNIIVNALCPGFIPSEINKYDENMKKKASTESLMDIGNNLNDITNFIEFLCTDKLRSVTGQVFHVDSRIL